MIHALSSRELEILAAAAAGETQPETARRLHISPSTVKAHRARILAKLGARTIAQAVALGLERQGAWISSRTSRSISPTKRDAFHAKASELDRTLSAPPRTSKLRALEHFSERLRRPLTSANDLTEDEARDVLDWLEHQLAEAKVAGGREEPRGSTPARLARACGLPGCGTTAACVSCA